MLQFSSRQKHFAIRVETNDMTITATRDNRLLVNARFICAYCRGSAVKCSLLFGWSRHLVLFRSLMVYHNLTS